jgi:hypothetical protein
MNRFQRSLALLRTSWSVLRVERQLLLMPVCSAIVSLLAAGVLALAALATLGREAGVDGTTRASANAGTIAIALVGYLVLAFVTVYFSAALVAGANARLTGGDPTFSSCIAEANRRLPRILGWSLVVATVSIIIDAIESRNDMVGSIMASVFNAAWSVVTYLAVPIIVLEDLGPIAALKRSGSLLKQTWGENLMTSGGIGLIGLVAVALPAFVLVVLGVAAGTPIVTVPLVAIAVIWCLVGATVLSALSGIARTALYRYAVDGEVPAAFAGSGLEHAFTTKPARR